MRPDKEPSIFKQRLVNLGYKVLDIVQNLDFSTPAEGPLRSQGSGVFRESVTEKPIVAIEADLSDFTNGDLEGLAWGIKNLPTKNPDTSPDDPTFPPAA